MGVQPRIGCKHTLAVLKTVWKTDQEIAVAGQQEVVSKEFQDVMNLLWVVLGLGLELMEFGVL